jgi:hypothetical protein
MKANWDHEPEGRHLPCTPRALPRRFHGHPDKLAGILAKTWNKMSPSGCEAALKLALPPAIPALLEQGLARFRGNR